MGPPKKPKRRLSVGRSESRVESANVVEEQSLSSEAENDQSSVLLNLENCIRMCFGDFEDNTVNFKMLQTVLHILGGQLKMLSQDVEVKFESPEKKKRKKAEAAAEKDKKEGKDDKKDKSKPDKKHELAGEKSEEIIGSLTGSKGDLGSLELRTMSGGLASRPRAESILVVNRADFDVLQGKVNRLLELLGPIPSPRMPGDAELKGELVAGTATLADVMEGLQVNARVKAAEQGLSRMADLLAQLMQAKAFPDEMLESLSKMQELLKALGIVIPSLEEEINRRSDGSLTQLMEKPISRTSSILSTMSTTNPGRPVTKPELNGILAQFRQELKQSCTRMNTDASFKADRASVGLNNLTEKVEEVKKLDERIDGLKNLAEEYASCLGGFNDGVTIQLKSFQESMASMKVELAGGLAQVDSLANSEDTLAVQELKKIYRSLQNDHSGATQKHCELVHRQEDLWEDLRNLLERVEVLREEKADVDEVTDGLRDKADISRIRGLLKEKAFDQSRGNFYKRLDIAKDKFRQQDEVWHKCHKDITNLLAIKASMKQLVALKNAALDRFQDARERLAVLRERLRQPEAALLAKIIKTRMTSVEKPVPYDPEEHRKFPSPREPRPRPRSASPSDNQDEDPCMGLGFIGAPPSPRAHACNRWAGGSHTLVNKYVSREQAQPLDLDDPCTNRHVGYGDDGRLYWLEESLRPCVECSQLYPEETPRGAPPTPEIGGGDGASTTKI